LEVQKSIAARVPLVITAKIRRTTNIRYAMPSRISRSVRKQTFWQSIAGCATISTLLLTVVSGCGHKTAAKGDAAQTPETLAVVTTTPRLETIRRSIVQPGYLSSYEETPIYTKLAGYLKEVNVDIGDKIKNKQLLGLLWVPEVEKDVAVKEARVRQGKADVTLAQEMLEVARANVETREAKVDEAKKGQERAKSECARSKNEWLQDVAAVKQGINTKQTEDEALNQYTAAQARLEEAGAKVTSAEASLFESKAKHGKAKEDVGVAEEKLIVLNAQYREQKAWFDYAEITAPYDGIVTRRFVHTGHFVQPANSGTTSKTAEPLFVVMRTDRMRVVIQVPESDAPLVKDGADAIVRIQSLNDREIQEWFKLTDQAIAALRNAHVPEAVLLKLNPLKNKPLWRESLVKEIAKVLSPDEIKQFQDPILNAAKNRCKVTRNAGSLNTESRTLRVEIFLDNPEEELQAGMYVNVSIIADLPNAMTLPVDAILIDGNQYYCFVVEDGKVKRVNVKVGVENDRWIQLLSKQIPPTNAGAEGEWVKFTGTERVIVSNLTSIQDGQPVTIK
jgi:multidrug efflux pump subunit AcrA (membrane-fusion protein)